MSYLFLRVIPKEFRCIMENKDVIYTDNYKVKCEGQEDDLGHPLVYLEIKEEQITCPYCSKIFKLKK